MHWFSRIQLNAHKNGGRRLLGNPQAMHAAVLAAFPPGKADPTDEGRVLWRVDRNNYEYKLYVVSHSEPDFAHIVEQGGWPTAPAETKPYSPFLDRLQTGQEWNFKLSANPVVSVMKSPGTRGVVLPHVTVAQQSQWLLDRSKRHGFELITEQHEIDGSDPSVAVTKRDSLRFSKFDNPEHRGDRNRVTINRVEFEGALRVTNVEELRNSLVNGIGRAKAYGCGLLTLYRGSSAGGS